MSSKNYRNLHEYVHVLSSDSIELFIIVTSTFGSNAQLLVRMRVVACCSHSLTRSIKVLPPLCEEVFSSYYSSLSLQEKLEDLHWVRVFRNTILLNKRCEIGSKSTSLSVSPSNAEISCWLQTGNKYIFNLTKCDLNIMTRKCV